MSEDCFTLPPGVHEYGGADITAQVEWEKHTEKAVQRYVHEHPSEAGNIVFLGSEGIAVGFTARACFHRRGLATALGWSESRIRVFRVAHPQRAVRRVHHAMMRDLRENNFRDFAGYEIEGFGPGVRGTEEVSMSGNGSLDELRERLAAAYTNGDTSWFTVTRADPNRRPRLAR